MEPRIQYAKTKDGVSIAFYTMGEGTPVIVMPWIPWSHLEREWQVPELRRNLEPYIESFMLVRYDHRGSGLSERDVTNRSLDAHLLDLEAIISQLGLERFALVARSTSAPVAIAYMARNPERVSRLVLAPMSYARASDIYTPQMQRIVALMEVDWELYTETLAHWALRWSEGEAGRRGAAYFRECVTQQEALAAHKSLQEIDVSDDLSQVRTPTLVVHHRSNQVTEINVAKGLAASISNARLVIVEETGQATAAIAEFLGEGEGSVADAGLAEPSAFRTILFTDMEGSTTLTQRLGDAAAQEVLRTHNAIVRDALKAHDGSETKHTGDGIMASFSSASRALECAIAIQRAFHQHNAAVTARPEPVEGRAPEPIRIRIGLNAGEPVAEEDDLFGTAVQLAARICAHAEPGQILASNVVQELAAGKRFVFADKGEAALKGFDKPVRLHEVRWQEG